MLSPLASVLRGSVAGLTFLSNQFHQIVVRQRTSPVNPSSLYQTLVRSSFSIAAAAWTTVSIEDQAKWDDYAATVPFSGPLGTYYVTGRHLFMAQYAFLTTLNAYNFGPYVVSTAPPTLSGRPVISDFTVSAPSAPGTGFEIAVDNPGPEDIVYMASISQPLPNTRHFWKGPFDSATVKSDTIVSAGSDDLVFSDLTDGLVYFCRIRGCEVGSPGRVTIEHIIRCVAETTV